MFFSYLKTLPLQNTENSQGISVINPWKLQVANLTIFFPKGIQCFTGDFRQTMKGLKC